MKRIVKKIAVTTLILSTGLLGACKDGQQAQAPRAAGPMEVNVLTVTSRPTQLTIELPGRTAAYRVAEVRPQVSGIIKKRLFTEGSEVKAGELLYQIDPATYQAVLASAEAALARNEAQEYSSRLKAARYANLVKTKAVSEQEQIDAEASWKQAQAEVAAAKAEVQRARINFEYTKVTAPIGGRIGKTLVSEGALVTAQQVTALASIQQLDPLYVDVSQSSNELLHLKRKLAATQAEENSQLKTAVRVVLDDNSLYKEVGMLKFSDPSVDLSTGTVTIRAIIGNPHQDLLPGMFVRARLTSEQPQDAILIPQASIVRNNRGEAMVMLVNDKSTVEARLIATGQNIGDKIMVSKGLTDGEQLIVSGLQKIKPGVAVKVATEQPEVTTAQPGPEKETAPAEQKTPAKVN
ncbi:MAG: efflux RND transporter periplasmic adaptor subunit [Proteobacteria bacterium]|nr:efflux RND transporter periplasmic adaptor subunit [Pseudomonadota bacterium]